MKNIFNQTDTMEILKRIDELTPTSRPLWGKMVVAQMLAHCSAFQDIAMGNTFPPRGWLGILIGPFVKSLFFNDKPFARSMSTIPSILIVEEKEFESEKEKLKQKIVAFQKNGPEKCTSHPHSFFGKLTPEQWGMGIYKHLDHHLNQFGV